MKKGSQLRLPGLEISQGNGRLLYSFAIDGKVLPMIATVSRVRRDNSHAIHGYQRPEVLSHIQEIRKYIESDRPMIPNAVVVAFDESISFVPSTEHTSETNYSRIGTIVIPCIPDLSDEEKPGWIVDGQQRLAAIRDAAILSFPICVVGFVTSDMREQREQFILVNSTKPLPKGLIYELLPNTEARLPTLLQRRRFPAYLLDRLNYEDDSPMKGRIRTPTTTTGTIKDNSVLKLLENSLSDGVLYRFREPSTGEGDSDAMLAVLKNFWNAVAIVFKTAWELPPRHSRLTHGAGIVAMGYLMDAIAARYRQIGIPHLEQFQRDLEPLKDFCRWTDGYWDFGPGAQRKWNEIQNTTKDIELLSNYLLVQYRNRVWNQGSPTVT